MSPNVAESLSRQWAEETPAENPPSFYLTNAREAGRDNSFMITRSCEVTTYSPLAGIQVKINLPSPPLISWSALKANWMDKPTSTENFLLLPLHTQK